MDVEDAYSYLAEAAAVSKLESFMIFGGEPMLYPERATAIIKTAYKLRIPRIEMITNGLWAKNERTAEKLAMRLKTAGLNTINISVDAFHRQYIPVEYPQNAASASLKAGIENVKWNVAVIDSVNAPNEYDKKTAEILEKLRPRGIKVSTVKIVPVGRATRSLRHHFQPTSLYGSCEGDPLTGNTLANPESICVEPSGSACICWNLPIGNAKTVPLRQIITDFEWRRNTIIRTLMDEGPIGLLRLHEADSFRFREKDYINKCHLCIEIRRTLKPYYPNAYS